MKEIISLFLILAFSSTTAVWADKDVNEHGDIQAYHAENTTEIANNIAVQVGIETALTGAQTVRQSIQAFGRLTTGPEQTSHVRARFPGMIKSVDVSIGDVVSVGDLLAIVESNDSLQRYRLTAPIAGTVVEQHANVGEMTQQQILFSISNLDTLWAQLRIFPSQHNNIKVGQPVYIVSDGQRFNTTVSHLLPAAGSDNYFVARAKIDSAENSLFTGLMVKGLIVVKQYSAAVAVENIALQLMDGETGVFTKSGDKYAFSPVVLGRVDDQFTEVLSGLDSGVEYVTNNSYLVKADIEKSAAEHKH